MCITPCVCVCSLTGKDGEATKEDTTTGVEHIDHSGVVESHNGEADLVPSSPEQRYREVLSIPVTKRPLFPGVIMPVMVRDNRVIKELVDIRKQGYVGYCVIQEKEETRCCSHGLFFLIVQGTSICRSFSEQGSREYQWRFEPLH